MSEKVKKSLQHFWDHGVSVSKSKFHFAKLVVKYVGYTKEADRIELDPTKVKAMASFPLAANQTKLRSFMGLIIEMSGHSKEISEATLPLQRLMKKKNTFHCMEEHQKAMDKLK